MSARAQVANRLKELREHKGVTQKDVGEAIGMSVQGYSGYETGFRMPGRNRLTALANYYNVSVDYVLGDTNIIVRPGEEIILPSEIQAYFRGGKYEMLDPKDKKRLLALIKGFLDE